MGIHLTIPDSITQAMRLPRQEQHDRLIVELAVTLYAQGILPFGKARELAGMSKFEFGRLLGERKITRHYSQEDLENDITYAGRE